MDVVIRSDNNRVYDMTEFMSGFMNDLDNAIRTKSNESLFG